MIISRYLTKEISQSFLGVTFILLIVALSNRVVVYLSKAAAGMLPLSVVCKMVGLYIPDLLGYLLPLGFYIAILFTLGRLYVDHEMIILKTSGLGLKFLMKIILKISGILFLIALFLSLWLIPKCVELREKIGATSEAFGVVDAILPGRFQFLEEGRIVYYVEKINQQTKQMHNVFIAEQSKSTEIPQAQKPWTIITAEIARLKQNEKTKDYFLVLQQGNRYTGIPGQADFTVVKFEEYGTNIIQKSQSAPALIKLKPTLDLIQTQTIDDKAELEWRMAFAISLPILGLIALCLSKVEPRQGRFAKFLPAILIYIAYYNLLIVARRWMITHKLPSTLGLWWVHGLMLALTLTFILIEMGKIRINWKHLLFFNKGKIS
ncbi:MAG: lptF [Francisellaceae bacterium]|nr:lptF [Francisellaceae bacterium]